MHANGRYYQIKRITFQIIIATKRCVFVAEHAYLNVGQCIANNANVMLV